MRFEKRSKELESIKFRITLQRIALREHRSQVEELEISLGGEGDGEMPLSLCIRTLVNPGPPTIFGITWSVVSPRQGYCFKAPKFFNVDSGLRDIIHSFLTLESIRITWRACESPGFWTLIQLG